MNTPAGVLIGVLTAIVLLWGRLDDTLADMRQEFRTEIRALDERTQARFDVIERRLDRIEKRHAEDFAELKAEIRELREPLIAEALRRRPNASGADGE